MSDEEQHGHGHNHGENHGNDKPPEPPEKGDGPSEPTRPAKHRPVG